MGQEDYNPNGTVVDPERAGKVDRAAVADGDGKLLPPPIHVGQGGWLDAAWHMGTAVPTPAAIFPLPYALSRLGWPAGILALVAGAAVTAYTSCLLAGLNMLGGKRHARYRDLAFEVWGVRGAYFTVTFQLAVNLGSLVTIAIPSGLGLQFMYQQYYPGQGPTLQEWIIVFMALQVLLAMLPNLHELRIVNMMSTMCVIIMSVIGFALTIYDGNKLDRSTIDYGVHGTDSTKAFSVFNALATISLAYGNTMLPEIQATIREPVIENMYKTIAGAYVIVIAAYFGVGIAGYWAYGWNVGSYLLFTLNSPRWAVIVANAAAVFQFAASFQFYCQLCFEWFETKYSDVSKSMYAPRNVIPRFAFRTTLIGIITLVSCAIPFFGDFVALVGAAGYTPMDFVLPIIMYVKVHNLKGLWYWGNLSIAIFYILVGVCGCIGAVRYIIVDATTYKLFANL